MTSATRNAISVSSPGGVPDLVEMTLTVSHGTLALVGVDGLRLREGGLGAAPRITFVGRDVDLNTALDGLTFFPEAQFVGTADVCVGVRYASKSAVDQRLCDESSLPAANGLSDERSSMSTGFTIRVRPQPVAVVQPKPGDSGTRK